MRKILIFGFLSILFFPVIISIFLVYTRQEGVNDCMLTYVKKLKNGYTQGYWYTTPYGYHIDTEKIENYGEIIDKPQGCIFYNREKKYLSFFNTIYCFSALILKT